MTASSRSFYLCSLPPHTAYVAKCDTQACVLICGYTTPQSCSVVLPALPAGGLTAWVTGHLSDSSTWQGRLGTTKRNTISHCTRRLLAGESRSGRRRSGRPLSSGVRCRTVRVEGKMSDIRCTACYWKHRGSEPPRAEEIFDAVVKALDAGLLPQGAGEYRGQR